MTHPAQVRVNTAAVRHNLGRVRELAPGRRVLAVIKSDAYGHGIEHVLPALSDADAFGVCCLEEARIVREAGVRQWVLLLEGCHGTEELREASALQLHLVVHCEEQLRLLERTRLRPALSVWIKIDTGMHRLGFAPQELAQVLQRLQRADGVAAPLRLLTHLAAAGAPGHALTGIQLRRFAACAESYRLERSLANSAAILSLPQSHGDWVRPGLMLYGASPLPGRCGADHGLMAAMELRSRLIAVHDLNAGDQVGYGGAWYCPQDMRVGIVAIGYGNGYPRHAPSGTPVQVAGQPAALIGPASMDMLAVDLRHCPQSRTGDTVLLWGPELPVERVAACAGTIPHQLLSVAHCHSRQAVAAELCPPEYATN